MQITSRRPISPGATQIISTSFSVDPMRGYIKTSMTRNFQLFGLHEGRRHQTFQDALTSARMLSEGRALGVAVVRESDGLYEVHKVSVIDVEERVWIGGSEVVSSHRHHFTAADVMEGVDIWTSSAKMVSLVDGDWCYKAVQEGKRGVALLPTRPSLSVNKSSDLDRRYVDWNLAKSIYRQSRESSR